MKAKVTGLSRRQHQFDNEGRSYMLVSTDAVLDGSSWQVFDATDPAADALASFSYQGTDLDTIKLRELALKALA